MKTFFAFLVLVFVAFHDASAVNYTDCTTYWAKGLGKVTSVQINDCPEDDYECKITFFKTMNISIAFDCNNDFTSAKIQGLILFDKYNTPEIYNPKSDACKDGGLPCPLKKGESYTYKQSIDIQPTYIDGNQTLRWTLKDDKWKYIICVEFPVVISS